MSFSLALAARRGRAAFISDITWGEGEAGTWGCRRAGALAQPPWSSHSSGWWAVGTQGALCLLASTQPTPAVAGAHTVGCAQKGRRSVFQDSPLTSRDVGTMRSTHARHGCLLVLIQLLPVARPHVHPHTYWHMDGTSPAEVWVTPK